MVEPAIKEETRLTGNGRVRDQRGQEVTVRYTVIVSKDVANSNGQRFANGSFTRTGQANIDYNHDLTLVLEDCRELRIIPTTMQGPTSPTDFLVRSTADF